MTSTAEQIVALVTDLAEIYGTAKATRTFAQDAASRAEYDNLIARANYWDGEVDARYAALVAALHEWLPAAPETFLPVQVLPNGSVEIRARDGAARPVVVRFTAAQALALGAHLAAYAAIGIDRTADKITAHLPAVPATPAFTATRATPATDPDPAAQPARVVASAPPIRHEPPPRAT
jgi:hypothetical protein